MERGKAKMAISQLTIPPGEIVFTGGASEGTIGHTFKLKAMLKVSKRTLGLISGEGIDYPELEWFERIDWFELIAPNTWRFDPHPKNGEKKDMYAENPSSNTFRIWATARYFVASDVERNGPPEGLKAAINAKAGAALEELDKVAKHWIAENGFEWTIEIIDRPAIGLKPIATSRGGGGPSLVTSNSRRRVIDFELGFKGRGARVTATQVLESINGVPTMQKFFLPAIPRSLATDDTKLALWRSQLGQDDRTFVP